MIGLKGQARLELDDGRSAVCPNNVNSQVVTGLINKIASPSYQYPDELVPTRISLQDSSGASEFKDISNRSLATSGSLVYLDFHATGFAPATSSNQPVQAFEIKLMSSTSTIATANMMAAEINPNPNIYAYQTANVSYRLTLSGANTDWMERLLRVVQGKEFMTSNNWVADNDQFVTVNHSKLYYGSSFLASSSFEMSVEGNQQQQFRLTVDGDVSFSQLESSYTPNEIKYYALDTKGQAQLIGTATVSEVSQFATGDNIKVPFSIIMSK